VPHLLLRQHVRECLLGGTQYINLVGSLNQLSHVHGGWDLELTAIFLAELNEELCQNRCLKCER
jgi:hypothetical protein